MSNLLNFLSSLQELFELAKPEGGIIQVLSNFAGIIYYIIAGFMMTMIHKYTKHQETEKLLRDFRNRYFAISNRASLSAIKLKVKKEEAVIIKLKIEESCRLNKEDTTELHRQSGRLKKLDHLRREYLAAAIELRDCVNDLASLLHAEYSSIEQDLKKNNKNSSRKIEVIRGWEEKAIKELPNWTSVLPVKLIPVEAMKDYRIEENKDYAKRVTCLSQNIKKDIYSTSSGPADKDHIDIEEELSQYYPDMWVKSKFYEPLQVSINSLKKENKGVFELVKKQDKTA